MSTLQVATIQTNTPAGVLAVRDSNDALTSIQPSALRGTAANTAPVFQDSSGAEIGTLCRAWVNFNGTGTVAIRASFNVSTITDNGTGDYTVNFTNPMPDASYVTLGYGGETSSALNQRTSSVTANNVRFFTSSVGSGSVLDIAGVYIAIFR
jgi:hypothetical protein